MNSQLLVILTLIAHLKASTTEVSMSNCDNCVLEGKDCSHDNDGRCLDYLSTGHCPEQSTDCVPTETCQRCIDLYRPCKHDNDDTCYEFPTNSGSCYPGTTLCHPMEEPCDIMYNMVFIIDESGSVGNANYMAAIDLVINLIQNSINSNANLGAIGFANDVDIIYSLTFTQNDARVGIINALMAEQSDFNSGGTQLGKSIDAAIADFIAFGADSNDENYIVVLTDGRPSTPVCPGKDADLVAAGIDVIIAGIGGGFISTDVDCLADPSDIFEAANFGDTELQELEDNIGNRLCPEDNNDNGLPESCDNCVASGYPCTHNDNGVCHDYMEYGGCPAGTTDCVDTDHCARCLFVGKPCKHDNINDLSCTSKVFGVCPPGTTECNNVCQDILEYNLLLLIDESGSIGRTNFENTIDLTIIPLIENGVSDMAKLAAYSFSTNVQLLYSFNDIQNDNRVSIIMALENEKNNYAGGRTRTSLGIDAAINEFMSDSNYDINNNNILLLFTDGVPFPSEYGVCPDYNDIEITYGIRVIIAAIGSFNQNAVECLADSSDIFSTSFDLDDLEQLEQQLTQVLCSETNNSY